MKFRRFVSALLFAAGCALLFVSLLAYALNYLSSPQIALFRESFFTPSDQPAVQLINRAMQLVMAQHWQTAAVGILVASAGLLMMNRFSRKPMAWMAEDEKSLQQEVPTPEPAPERTPEQSNPFATDVYNQRIQLQMKKARPAFPLPSEPILERNSIETVQPEAFADEPAEADETMDDAPYVSYRFRAEAQAVEAQADEPSQSGSRMLTRPIPEEDFEPVDDEQALFAFQPLPVPDEEPACGDAPETPAAMPEESPAAQPPLTPPPSPPSLRIRSTMGRHGNRKTNFS